MTPLFPERFVETRVAVTEEVTLFVRHAAHADPSAPALLLLHGFPQTGAIWHRVAPAFVEHYHIVCPDLRGYGRSAKPASSADHGPYSKRVLAADLATLMQRLGYERYAVVGHDRGGRVAHRLALDFPERVSRLMLLDISPTLTMYERTDMEFARAYWHWFFLIQPAPMPESLLLARAPDTLHQFLRGWGSQGGAFFDPRALAEYEAAWTAPGTLFAMCEDYRASAGIDLEHDRASRAAGQHLQCPLHLLWGERGVVHRLFSPLADWRALSRAPVTGHALPAGHFLPEEVADRVSAELADFLG